MGVFEDIMFIVHACWFQKVDKPARLTIVPDCQIRYKKTNSETVTLSTKKSSKTSRSSKFRWLSELKLKFVLPA